jgi:hypothetical protein
MSTTYFYTSAPLSPLTTSLLVISQVHFYVLKSLPQNISSHLIQDVNLSQDICCGLNCISSQIYMLKFKTPVPQNVIISGDRVIEAKSKLTFGHRVIPTIV